MTYTLTATRPLPPPARRGPPPRYPFADMAPGESFLADAKAVAAAAKYAQRHPGWRFRAAAEGDGMRIWRAE